MVLGWLTGGGTTNAAFQQNSNIPPATAPVSVAADNAQLDEPPIPSQPSALMFPVNAFRTAIFGTPAAKRPPPRPVYVEKRNDGPTEAVKPSPHLQKPGPELKARRSEDQQSRGVTFEPVATRVGRRRTSAETKSPQQDNSGDDAPVAPIPFKINARPTIFDKSVTPPKLSQNLFDATPARPVSPTKGILRRASVGPKKAVTFDPALADETPKAKPGERVRSGLPHEYPGKFPSPWTPRTGRTPKLGQRISRSLGSLEETSKPVESVELRKPTVNKITEDSRIEDILAESDNEGILTNGLGDADLTTDMTAPKSASGQYWKEHAENLEEIALSKVEKLRNRCYTAIEYAQRKDELCVNLAERLREVMDKNQRLKDELKRINQGCAPSTSDNGALARGMFLLAEKESQLAVANEENALKQQIIEQLTTKVAAFEDMLNHREDKITELSMTIYDDEDAEEQVHKLKQKLRKARQENKEMGPLRIQCRVLKSKVSALEHEKAEFESRLNSTKNFDDTLGANPSFRPDQIDRLKAEIQDLEKARQDLKVDMRTKATEANRERREAEKALRAEISDLKAKLVGEELDKKELAEQVERQRKLVASLEKQLERAMSFNELGDHGDWQNRHRATLLELRRAKDELSILKADGGEDAHGQSLGYSSFPPRKQEEHLKDPASSASDDSAVDRTYDRFSHYDDRPRSRSNSPNKNRMFDTPLVNPPAEFGSSSFNLPNPPSVYRSSPPKFDFGEEPVNPSTTPTPTPAKSADRNVGARRLRASPRPTMVGFSPAKRKSSAIRRTAIGTSGSKALDGMDPTRRLEAERRVAERRARRKTTS